MSTGSVDRWILGSYPASAEALGAQRVLFAAMLLFALGPPDLVWMGGLPDYASDPPPGLAMLLDGFPPPWVFHSLRWLVVAFSLAVLVGHRTKTASIGLGLSMLVLFSFGADLGVRGAIFLVVFPLAMAFSNWGAALSLDAARSSGARPRVSFWPISYLALLLGFLMFTAGAVKALSGWLGPSLAARGHLLRGYLTYDRGDLLAPMVLGWDAPIVWQLADLATVGLEVGFLFAILSPPVFRAFCALAVFFHTGVLLGMNIDYSLHLPLYAVFFLGSLDARPGFAPAVARWEERLRSLRWLRWPHLLLAAAAWCAIVPPGECPLTLAMAALGLPTAPHRGLLLLLPASALAAAWLVTRVRVGGGPVLRQERAR